jgi:hypothetical protein
VTVAGEPGNLWQGNITRITGNEASVQVVATDARVPARPDSVVVVIVAWEPIALRLVKRGTDSVITEVFLNTDQEIDLEVQGQHSNDPNVWTVVDANWLMLPNPDTLLSSNPLPASTQAISWWRYSPINPGDGILNLKDPLGRTPELNVPVHVTPAPPSKITIRILTPADSLIAGQPILAEVVVENHDGRVPGQWCGSGVFTDILGPGYTGVDPTVSYVTQDGSTVTVPIGTPIGSMCFTDGVAYPTFVLYYAPYSKDPHNITVNMQTPGSDNTGPFLLLPGPLDRLVLEDVNNNPIGDTLRLSHPDGATFMFARGYDQWGNKRGDEIANWDVTGTLHALSSTQIQGTRVYYATNTVTQDEEGFIRATAATDATKSDQVYMIITGPKVPLTVAYTRDLDGDGYLDAIDLYFPEEITVPAGYDFAANMAVRHASLTFTNTGLVGLNGTPTDTVFRLSIAEDSIPPTPQTGWTPYLSLTGLEGVADVPEGTFECTDGAGPVIWRVEKRMPDVDDRSKDRITVIFSEAVFDSDGTLIKLNTPPADLFVAYDANLDTLSGMFDGIEYLTVVGDSIVEFVMTNNKDLSPNYYMNINWSTHLVIDAAEQNEPHQDNRKVRVTLVNAPPPKAVPFPNPTTPIFSHKPPSVFEARYEPQAWRWVHDDRAGVAVRFTITIPDPTQSRRVRAAAKIYDVVGNLVQSAVEEDLLQNVPTDLSVYDVDIYWNGSNSSGMPVAPGTYRMVIYVDYDEPTLEDAKMATNVGIGR